MSKQRPLLGIDLDPDFREFEKMLGDSIYEKPPRKRRKPPRPIPKSK